MGSEAPKDDQPRARSLLSAARAPCHCIACTTALTTLRLRYVARIASRRQTCFNLSQHTERGKSFLPHFQAFLNSLKKPCAHGGQLTAPIRAVPPRHPTMGQCVIYLVRGTSRVVSSTEWILLSARKTEGGLTAQLRHASKFSSESVPQWVHSVCCETCPPSFQPSLTVRVMHTGTY